MLKKVLGSMVICSFTLTGVSSSLPLAENAMANVNDDIGSRDYQEIQGTYLLVHFTGVDEQGNELSIPKYMEFPLEEGGLLNKQVLEQKVQQTLDSQVDTKFEFVRFTKDTKLELHKKNNVQPFPITDAGFRVVDYSDDQNNAQFRLSGNIVIKPKEIKETRTDYSNDTDVQLFHEVKFKKKIEGTNNLTSSIMSIDTPFEKKVKVGTHIKQEDLQNAAQKAFEETEDYKKGYRLVKRLNTSVLENGRTPKKVYHHLYNTMFNYDVSKFREKPTRDGHIDVISEDYYISKQGDDYMPEQQEVVIELKDDTGLLLKEIKLNVSKANAMEEIKKYISENNLTEIKAKNGKTYQFIQTLNHDENQHFTAVYKEM
ncbi:hypothetical protein KJB58_01355 [Staphylococcus hyicus]|uniref:hypothetical protein n=1 Tax=Staphylococcus hyicus TaxID=1284 RepID=UPI001F295953|nr:hypothetical protein [Staphylococcus hyicus]MCE5153103.1 hypothetical protein [Staphylococcus hyicus]